MAVVQNRLRDWGDLYELPLKYVTWKACFLLALASFSRVSELASMARKDFFISSMTISLKVPRKSQSEGPLQRIIIQRYGDKDQCPVFCLSRYLELTKDLVNPEFDSLFGSPKRRYHPVGVSAIGKWIKATLQKLGVNTSVYSAHSTRGAAASAAFARGSPVDSILKTAN